MSANQHRRDFVRVVGAAASGASAPASLVRAQGTNSTVKFGWSISKTGRSLAVLPRPGPLNH